jgi:hypothetical protein
MRIPSEFRYWDNVGTPWAKRLRGRLMTLFGADPLLPDAIVERFAASYYDADPVAEAFVDDVYLVRGQSEGRAMLDRALAGGVGSVPEAPPSLRSLFAELEAPPAWYDARVVDLGARVFRRFGTHMFSFAGAITLQGYRESSVAKPLAFTGAYDGDSANKRFLETASFWLDVARPGGLDAGGKGRATALRVRMMHVFVRRRLLAHPKWDLDAWGVPISQGDALLTLMGGSFVPGYGLKSLGYRTSREEIEAMMLFWRWVGHLMGVSPRWYPQTVDDALGLMFTTMVKGAGLSGDDGASLARSYVASYAPTGDEPLATRLARRWEHALQRGYVGWFVPPETREEFGLPSPGPFWVHPLLQAPVVFARETVRRRSARVDDWLDRRARNEAEAWVAARLAGRSADYRAAEHLTR